MNYVDEFQSLAEEFKRKWSGRTGVAWPNVVFTPPSPMEPWCRFSILSAGAERMSMGVPGQNRATYAGRIVLQVFVPKGAGEIKARRLADQAAEIFRGFRLSAFRFDLPSIKDVTASTAGLADRWYQVNVDMPFRRDVFHG